MEGATCSSCALDGSRESVKYQVRQEACVPSWNNQLHYFILFILFQAIHGWGSQ